MHIEVLDEGLDVSKLLAEANQVKVMMNIGWGEFTQAGLQGYAPNLPPKHSKDSVGRVDRLQYPETYFKYPLFDFPNINRLMDKYGLIRTRLMMSQPKTCLTLHQDLSKRIHIPLMTTPDSVMIIENQVYHLEAGKVYLTNTTLRHTAVNASRAPRLHIVGAMYS